MEVLRAILDAAQSQLFQTVGLVVIVISLAELERRCRQIEERIEILRRHDEYRTSKEERWNGTRNSSSRSCSP